MKKSVFALVFLFSNQLWAISLKDYKPFEYEVLFTNPECAEYTYPQPVLANNGESLLAKPKNVYCKPADHARSAKRANSPHKRLLDWITHKDTKDIFMAYLSFSNPEITDALCAALKKGTTLSLVLDAKPGETNKHAESLKECGQASVYYRGNQKGLGFAHNKLMVINPSDAKTIKLVFSSANMSTGTSIHHENWNFVTTSPKSYFAQAHQCLMKGMIENGDSRKEFVAFIDQCRQAIATEEESDIQTYFVPGEGKKAFAAIKEMAEKSTRLNTTAHRFSGIFVALFEELLKAGKPLRLVTDDDMYWSYKTRSAVGRNTNMEAFKVIPMMQRGLEMQFMETNHNSILLQHNKFMVFELAGQDAVFTGAGNFTTSAFDNNFENYYVITIPEVVGAYTQQFDHFWDELSTPVERLPTKDIRP